MFLLSTRKDSLIAKEKRRAGAFARMRFSRDYFFDYFFEKSNRAFAHATA